MLQPTAAATWMRPFAGMTDKGADPAPYPSTSCR